MGSIHEGLEELDIDIDVMRTVGEVDEESDGEVEYMPPKVEGELQLIRPRQTSVLLARMARTELTDAELPYAPVDEHSDLETLFKRMNSLPMGIGGDHIQEAPELSVTEIEHSSIRMKGKLSPFFQKSPQLERLGKDGAADTLSGLGDRRTLVPAPCETEIKADNSNSEA